MAKCDNCGKKNFDPIDEMWSLHSPPLQEYEGESGAWLFCSKNCISKWLKKRDDYVFFVEDDVMVQKDIKEREDGI